MGTSINGIGNIFCLREGLCGARSTLGLLSRPGLIIIGFRLVVFMRIHR